MTHTEFLNHAVNEVLANFYNRLQNPDVTKKLNADKQIVLESVYKLITSKFKNIVAPLVNVEILNSISAELSNATSHINAFIESNNESYLFTALSHVNNVIIHVDKIPNILPYAEIDLSKEISIFHTKIQEDYNQLDTLQKKLSQEVEGTSALLLERQSEIIKLDDEIKLKKNEINDLSINFQNQFDTSTAEYVKKIDEDRTALKANADSDRQNLKSISNEIIVDLEKKQIEAKKLLNIIGNIGVTGNYQKIAEEHKKIADTWRYIAGGVMLALSILVILSIWNISVENYNGLKALIRIIASAILIYPATYASKESNKHRVLENSNRKLELELAAINPFIETLNETKKQEIKEKLVEKFFGNNDFIEKEIEKNDTVSVDIFEKVVKMISSVTKK